MSINLHIWYGYGKIRNIINLVLRYVFEVYKKWTKPHIHIKNENQFQSFGFCGWFLARYHVKLKSKEGLAWTLAFKLKSMGISGELYNLLENYLLGRFQTVVLNDHVSTWKPVLASVPRVLFWAHFLFFFISMLYPPN